MNSPDTLQMPAATAWPVCLAFGITLLFAGLVTSQSISILGAILAIAAAVGWFRNVLPHEMHESVPIGEETAVIETTRREVAHFEVPFPVKRVWLPLEIYPISAGLKGGLAGSVAMAAFAMLYGLLNQGSIWYPINLLVAGFFPAAVDASTAQIAVFH